MHRLLLLYLTMVFCGGVYAQPQVKLAKKFLGSYTGEIPAYSMQVGSVEVEVVSTPIQISIDRDQVELQLGRVLKRGSYRVLFESGGYFLLDCKIDGEPSPERIMVFKRGKRIARDGLYPQPLAYLQKL